MSSREGYPSKAKSPTMRAGNTNFPSHRIRECLGWLKLAAYSDSAAFFELLRRNFLQRLKEKL